MKKNISLLICICAFVILVPVSYFSIKRAIVESSTPATFISPLLTVFNFFLTRYLIKKENRIKRIQYQYDPLFCDRVVEYTLITQFIQNKESVLLIADKFGIGKTLLLKETADRINKHRIKRNKYHAIYVDVSNKTNISESLSKTIKLEEGNYSIDAISKKLKSKHRKNWVIFIDGVNSTNLVQAKDFADSMYNYANTKCIISIDGTINQGIKLSLFDKDTIAMLANKQGITISNCEIDRIFFLSKGMPVYIRFLLNQLKNNKQINFSNNVDIMSYIYSIIDKDINDNQKHLLSTICCLKILGSAIIKIPELLNLNRDCSKKDLYILEYYSFISLNNDKIIIENNIVEICLSSLGVYENKSYITIANYYVHINTKKELALLSMLHSNMAFNMDESSIEKIIHQKLQEGDYQYIIKIGTLDCLNKINPHIYDYKIYKYIQLEYFKSLLELGLYNEAEKVVKQYDFSKRGRTGVLGINNSIDFEIHYCVANLHHLTNDFDGAIFICMLLLKKCQTIKDTLNVKYLMAHCLRHKSSNNTQAIHLFKEITDEKKNLYISPQTYIRSCYSIVSIQMLAEENEENFEFSFSKMYQMAEKTNCSIKTIPYIKRHEIRYIANYKDEINKAISMAENEIKILEFNQFRIKYDYYFELAELFRIKFEREYDKKILEKSNTYYSAAIDFARISKDYNLESASLMGQSLLKSMVGIKINQEQINSIISETSQRGLTINYYYARFIRSVAREEKISNDLLNQFKSFHFANLHKAALKYNESGKYTLKLIVM